MRGRGAVPAGLGPVESVVLVTTDVVRDTPPDRHFSAWSRPKPAPDPLPGPSVASGVIPTKGGRNGPVPATSGRASTGRWRSSPWKRCNHAPPRSRVREHPAPLGALRPHVRNKAELVFHGQGAPRTARCIKTRWARPPRWHGRTVREHPAPLGALRPCRLRPQSSARRVREHPAPLGALRRWERVSGQPLPQGQGAPRTAMA